MRGIFWWNKEMDRSWKTMEKDTSPFQDKPKKKRFRKSRKSKQEYPEIHRKFRPDLEEYDSEGSKIVAWILLCLGMAFPVGLLIFLAYHSLIYFGIILGFAAAIVIWYVFSWRRAHTARWREKLSDEFQEKQEPESR